MVAVDSGSTDGTLELLGAARRPPAAMRAARVRPRRDAQPRRRPTRRGELVGADGAGRPAGAARLAGARWWRRCDADPSLAGTYARQLPRPRRARSRATTWRCGRRRRRRRGRRGSPAPRASPRCRPPSGYGALRLRQRLLVPAPLGVGAHPVPRDADRRGPGLGPGRAARRLAAALHAGGRWSSTRTSDRRAYEFARTRGAARPPARAVRAADHPDAGRCCCAPWRVGAVARPSRVAAPRQGRAPRGWRSPWPAARYPGRA